MPARIVILLLVIFLIVLILQRLKGSPAAASAYQRQQILYAVLIGSLIALALSGHLNWLFALLVSLLPLARRLLPYLGYIPRLRRLFSRAKTGDQAREKQTGATGNTKTRPPADNRMSVSEACKILNLPENANDEEIVAAHRRLIQKFHPDRGGSPHLASKINQARNILLDARPRK